MSTTIDEKDLKSESIEVKLEVSQQINEFKIEDLCDFSDVPKVEILENEECYSVPEPELIPCNNCPKKFATVSMLTLHKDVVHQKPFVRSSLTGDWGYARLGNVAVETKMSDEFKCVICDKFFLTQGKILRHMRTRHANNVAGMTKSRFKGITTRAIFVAPETGQKYRSQKYKPRLASNSWSYVKKLSTLYGKTCGATPESTLIKEEVTSKSFVADEDAAANDSLPLAGTTPVANLPESRSNSNIVLPVNLNDILTQNVADS